MQVELEELKYQLQEAHDTIEAIRTGQIDALMVETERGHELYTLRTADQGYRVFIENMSEGAVTLNKEGVIVYANSTFSSLVNVSLEKVIGIKLNDLISVADTTLYAELFDKSWNENCKAEFELIKGNTSIPVQLSFTSIEIDNEFSMCILVTDLTKQKQTAEALRLKNNELNAINLALQSSNNDLMQFASVASHDLQEPVRKINIFANLLHELEGGEVSEKALKYLNKIISSSERMKILILDLLNYSRLSNSANSFVKISIADIIQQVLTDLELVIEEKKAIVTIGTLPELFVNPSQMRQVFYNLLFNSLKFSKPGVVPEIGISSVIENDTANAKGGTTIKIIVTDNGIGFNNKYAGNIFTLFERLNTKDAYEGSGIGLSITKKIIEKHNGYISAESIEGKGSAFTITLPITAIAK